MKVQVTGPVTISSKTPKGWTEEVLKNGIYFLDEMENPFDSSPSAEGWLTIRGHQRGAARSAWLGSRYVKNLTNANN